MSGERVSLDVGGNLVVASRADTGAGSHTSYHAGASGYIGVAGGSSFSASLGGGRGNSQRTWVSEQTAITARDALTVDVGGHTQVDGAVLAAANDNLWLRTGTFGFSDLVDVDESSHVQATVGIRASRAANGEQQKVTPQGSPVGGTLSGTVANHNREQLTRATVGDGHIVLRDEASQTQDLAALNRDVDAAQEITRDESSGVTFYISTSALEEIGSGFAGVRGEVQAIERGIIDGTISVPNAVRDLISTGEMGLAEFAALVRQRENPADLPVEGGKPMAYTQLAKVGVDFCRSSPSCMAIVSSLTAYGVAQTQKLFGGDEEQGLTVSTPAHKPRRTLFATPAHDEDPLTVSTPAEEQEPTVLGTPIDLRTGKPAVMITDVPDYQFPTALQNEKNHNPDHKYHIKPGTIEGFSNLKEVNPKTSVRGGGRLRPRWKDRAGNIYEWDSQHGALEKYNKRGRHLGEFDHKTGKQTKPANSSRKVEP